VRQIKNLVLLDLWLIFLPQCFKVLNVMITAYYFVTSSAAKCSGVPEYLQEGFNLQAAASYSVARY
jgi:hypothetical protein